MRTYRITKYLHRSGHIKFAVHRKWLCFWIRIQRRFELADGMTDAFSREEAMRLIVKDAHRDTKNIKEVEIINL